MNWVLMAVLLTLTISAIVGYNSGMLRIAYSLVAWILVLMFVAWATPHINLYLLEKTSVYEKIEAHCEESVRLSANERVEQTQQQQAEGLTDEIEQEDALGTLQMSIPDTVVDGILEKTTGATEDFLEERGIYTAIAQHLANFVVEGIAILIALVMAWILVHLISQILGIVSRIPVIKGVNRVLGLFAGVIYGLLLVWLGFYVVVLGSTGELGQVIVSYIYDNPFLTFLYENNLVIAFILKYF